MLQEILRWWKLWKADVREGWGILGRFKVTPHGYPVPGPNIHAECVLRAAT